MSKQWLELFMFAKIQKAPGCKLMDGEGGMYAPGCKVMNGEGGIYAQTKARKLNSGTSLPMLSPFRFLLLLCLLAMLAPTSSRLDPFASSSNF